MTRYYQCDSCRKTSSEHELVWIDKEKGDPICRHCWGFVSYAFSVCTADQPEPSLGYCDGCDELEAELHLMDGDWLCDKCKAAVVAVQEDKAKAKEGKTMVEAVEDLKINWLKLWTWVALFLASLAFVGGVVHFGWGYYVS